MDKFFALHTVEDCKTLGLEPHDSETSSAAYNRLNPEMQEVLEGVSNRLRSVTWIMEQLKVATPPDAIVFHDMLSQVIYMLLACAEGMGRHWKSGSKKRFEAFFGNLPRATQDDLLAKFLVHNHTIPMPLSITSRDSLIAHRNTLNFNDAWKELVDCFYAWRNTATHAECVKHGETDDNGANGLLKKDYSRNGDSIDGSSGPTGRLIHTACGTRGGRGVPRTKRSGWAA